MKTKWILEASEDCFSDSGFYINPVCPLLMFLLRIGKPAFINWEKSLILYFLFILKTFCRLRYRPTIFSWNCIAVRCKGYTKDKTQNISHPRHENISIGWGRRIMTPLILNLGTTRRSAVNCKTWAFRSRKRISVPLNLQLVGPQSNSKPFGEKTNTLPLPGFEPRIM